MLLREGLLGGSNECPAKVATQLSVFLLRNECCYENACWVGVMNVQLKLQYRSLYSYCLMKVVMTSLLWGGDYEWFKCHIK